MRTRFVFALACAFVLPAVAAAPEDGPGKGPGIRPVGGLQRAIAAATAGDTVLVPGGIYVGNLLIDKRLILIGADQPVIRGEGSGSVLTIIADSCEVRGFTVEHSGTMLVDEDAGILLKSHHNTIAHNELRDILFGIYLLHAEENLIEGNRITGRASLDVGERGSGIHVWNAARNRFVENTIADVRDGLYIQNANNTWIERNDCSNLRYGLHYMYADSNVFLCNRFHSNVAGAAIMYSRGIRMRNNVFSHNRGFASFGILFQDCHGLVADSNIVNDNVVGMFFEASTNNTFRHNIIAQNDVALQMFQNATNNTFSENNFIDNLTPLTIVGKRTESRWNADGKGNYWSSYNGYDMNGDGVGDVPMRIQNVFQYLEGQNNNVRLYLYSPASQALAMAAEAFPIIRINQEADTHPLMRPVELHEMSPTDRLRQGGALLARPQYHPEFSWLVLPVASLAMLGYVYRRLSRRDR